MLRPMMGPPHRPGVVEVADEAFQEALRERLDSLGIRCVLADDLEQVDDIFQQLGKFLSGGKAARPLVDVPGVQPDDIRGFYAAAAEFYRAAPWRLVPGDTTLKIECRQVPDPHLVRGGDGPERPGARPGLVRGPEHAAAAVFLAATTSRCRGRRPACR